MSLFRCKKIFLHLIFSLFVLTILCFVASCKKSEKKAESETAGAETAEAVGDEGLYDFYNPFDDDAQWVDSAVMRAEEERIAEELARMEEALEEARLEEDVVEDTEPESESEPEPEPEPEPEAQEVPEEKNPVEKFFEEAGEGKTLMGKNNSMKFFEFNNEILSPQYTDDGFIIVHAADGNTVRSFYDLKYHLVKKEEWKIHSAADARKLRTELYDYSEETGKVVTKKTLEEKTNQVIFYNDASLPVVLKKTAVTEDEEYIVLEKKWSYDEEKRVIKDEQKEYNYEDEDYETPARIFNRRYEYTYRPALANEADDGDKDKDKDKDKDEIPPDVKYFENNVLKMQKVYSPVKGKYVSWIYFDAVLSVKTYYEDEVRVRDEYYNNGKLFRTKVYEKTVEAEGEEK